MRIRTKIPSFIRHMAKEVAKTEPDFAAGYLSGYKDGSSTPPSFSQLTKCLTKKEIKDAKRTK